MMMPATKGAYHEETTSAQPFPRLEIECASCLDQGEQTLGDMAQPFDVHPDQIRQWKTLLRERATSVVEGGGATQAPR